MNSCNCNKLRVPDTSFSIYDGTRIKINRFAITEWIVHYGWYSWGGNRAVCGWYLADNTGRVKPLQKEDLDDVYLVEGVC